MILGQETPDEGTITVGETVQIVSVGQERMEQLDSEKTVFDVISEGLEEIELGTQSIQSRAYLSWFGFKGAQQQAIVRNLSGGERNRVQLARMLKAGGNLIILDEPTNDMVILYISCQRPNHGAASTDTDRNISSPHRTRKCSEV
jgi:energy-dependent translational throttle protein EttA